MNPTFKIKNWQLLKVRGAEGKLTLPKGDFVAIGARAFAGKQNPYMESAEIPEGISVIKAQAFANSKNLRTVILPTAGNIGLSGGVFKGCARLREVANSEHINSIGDLAFADCTALQHIDLGKDLHRIGEGAFANCRSLTSIELPASLREIGDGAFVGCQELAFYTAPDTISKLSEEMFSNCVSLREVVIPSQVKVIDSRAFYACRNLKSVRMELGVQKIGAKAFAECNELCEVMVPHSVKSLGRGAFGLGKRKDGEKITVCVENEYMVRRMKKLLFWSGIFVFL